MRRLQFPRAVLPTSRGNCAVVTAARWKTTEQARGNLPPSHRREGGGSRETALGGRIQALLSRSCKEFATFIPKGKDKTQPSMVKCQEKFRVHRHVKR